MTERCLGKSVEVVGKPQLLTASAFFQRVSSSARRSPSSSQVPNRRDTVQSTPCTPCSTQHNSSSSRNERHRQTRSASFLAPNRSGINAMQDTIQLDERLHRRQQPLRESHPTEALPPSRPQHRPTRPTASPITTAISICPQDASSSKKCLERTTRECP